MLQPQPTLHLIQLQAIRHCQKHQARLYAGTKYASMKTKSRAQHARKTAGLAKKTLVRMLSVATIFAKTTAENFAKTALKTAANAPKKILAKLLSAATMSATKNVASSAKTALKTAANAHG